MEKNRMYDIIKLYRYYAIIIIMSLVALILLPALRVSEGDIGWSFPDSQVAWFIWAFTRTCVIIISLVIYVSFVEQGKLRASRTTEYKQANNIMIALSLVKPGEKKDPINPVKWTRTVKARKSIRLIYMSGLSFIAFGQLIIGFDLTTFLSYLWVIGSAILFGVMTMAQSEDIWSVGYLEYAQWRQQMYEKESQSTLEVKIEPKIEKVVEDKVNLQEEKIGALKEPKKGILDKLLEGDN